MTVVSCDVGTYFCCSISTAGKLSSFSAGAVYLVFNDFLRTVGKSIIYVIPKLEKKIIKAIDEEFTILWCKYFCFLVFS